MSTFDDIINDGKKYYPFARNKVEEQSMSPSPRPQADDNRGFTQQMSKEQQIEAAELTPEQVAQRSGVNVNASVQPQSGAVSVVSNGAPTSTRIVTEATPQVSTTPTESKVATSGEKVATPTVATTSSSTPLEKYTNGEKLTPEDYVALDKLSGGGRPKILGVNKNDEDILREQAGVPKETPETKAEVEDKADAEEEQERKTYEQMLKEMMTRRRPETPEEKEARQKREKRERLFASIADGLSAMHEAYSYGRGIKPMDIEKVSPKVLARQDRLRLLRDQEDRAWVSNYLNVMREKRLAEKDKAYNEYKQNMLALKSQQTDQQLRKLDAEIDRLIAQGKTEEAKQKLIEAQTLYTIAKSEGQTISNTYAPALLEAKIGQANRSNNKGGGGSRTSSPKSNKGGDQGGGSEQVVENINNLGQTTKKVTTTDANGNKTVKTYDHRGRLVNTQVTHPKRKPQSRPNNQQTTRKGATGQNSSMSKFTRRN